MMVVAAWGAIDAVGQVDKFMRYGYFDRLRLHIRFDENQVPMAG